MKIHSSEVQRILSEAHRCDEIVEVELLDGTKVIGRPKSWVSQEWVIDSAEGSSNIININKVKTINIKK